MTPTTINTLLNSLEEQAADATTALDGLSRTLLGHGYIVVIEGIPIRFNSYDRIATNPRPSSLGMATRFTQEDATRIASLCQNGHGAPGRAVHLADAYRERLAEITATRAYLEAQLAAAADPTTPTAV